MNRIAALDSGTQYHLISLHRAPFKKYFHKIIYLPELQPDDLNDVDTVLVTCASPVGQILAHSGILLDFLAQHKTLVVTGRNGAELWLPGVERVDLPFNFWWWLDKVHNSIDVQESDSAHPLFQYITFEHMIWHYHDGYRLLPNGHSAVEHKTIRNAHIFQTVDEYEGGRLVLTALDPFFHHGNFFMPNASRFGNALLQFVSELG